MGTTVVFRPTGVQKKTRSLLKSGAKHILLLGGSRSGEKLEGGGGATAFAPLAGAGGL
jgi:hypothetical protein